MHKLCVLCFVFLLPTVILNATDEFRGMEKSFFSAQSRGESLDSERLKQFAITLIEGLRDDVLKSNALEQGNGESYLGGDEDEFDEKDILDGEIARMAQDLFAVREALQNETYKKAIESVIQAPSKEFINACDTALQALRKEVE